MFVIVLVALFHFVVYSFDFISNAEWYFRLYFVFFPIGLYVVLDDA